jgi:serine/threonine protein kinase
MASQSTGVAYGVSADVYSFGIVLRELLAAKVPYAQLGNDGRGLHPIAVLYKVSNEGLRPEPQTAGWLVHAGLARLMEECWEKEPARRPRFTQILEWLAEVERAVEALAREGPSGAEFSSG